MKKKLLIIGFVWPEPKSSAAGSRMMQIIGAFKSQNYLITFVSTAAESEHAVDLKTHGVHVQGIMLNHESFDDFIKKEQPNVVIFDRFMTEEQFGWRVFENCPNALRILDTEDLHSLRKARQACHQDQKTFLISDWLQADITKREMASIYRCDLTLIISKYEMDLLQNSLNIDPVLLHYLPFMLEVIPKELKKDLPKYKNRSHFITIGNFRHEPNYDSVLYLKETIWPLIKKKLPEAEIHIYGAYPMQKVTQLQSKKDGFFIKGWANDVDEVMRSYRVCLAPLRFGAGLKGKFIDAMYNGTPCITTTIGAEGISENFGGYVEDLPSKIAERAIELYCNEGVWLKKQMASFEKIEEFATAKHLDQLIDKITETTKNLSSLRLRNFIGTMLQHQSLMSTKYLSKWIEAKNS